MSSPHPCLSCGACCASFRVDFSVHESEEHGGRVPRGLIEEVNDYTCPYHNSRMCMEIIERYRKLSKA